MKLSRPTNNANFPCKVFLKSNSQINTNYSKEILRKELELKNNKEIQLNSKTLKPQQYNVQKINDESMNQIIEEIKKRVKDGPNYKIPDLDVSKKSVSFAKKDHRKLVKPNLQSNSLRNFEKYK